MGLVQENLLQEIASLQTSNLTLGPTTYPVRDIDFIFTKDDVIEAINEVKPHAASGPDKIPIKVLKQCKLQVAKPILLIWK